MFRLILRSIILLGLTALFVWSAGLTANLVSNFRYWTWHHGINPALLGTGLWLVSLLYIVRKKRLITWGRLKHWLDAHILLGAAGIFLVLMHTGLQFRALLPATATALLVLVGLTGLFGWHVYLVTMKSLKLDVAALEDDEEYLLARMVSKAYRFWYLTHYTATAVVVVLTFNHVVAILLFRGAK